MQRREFLKVSATTFVGAQSVNLLSGSVCGRGPITRSGPPRFHLGLAAYSLRDYFSFKKGKAQTPAEGGKAIGMVGFLDYCVEQNVDAAELTSYFFRPDADDQYFLDLKHAAYVRGVTISGTAIGNNFTVGKGPKLNAEIDAAMKWIDRASVLGAPHIRFFAGTGKQLDGNPQRLQEAAEALAKCAEHAAKHGIFLGVENHGNLTPDQLLSIMGRVDNPWVGINLDTGNFLSADPYRDLERCIDYAVNVQVKVSMKTPDGKKYPADLNRVGKILREGNYQGFVILEYEDEDPYGEIPRALERLREGLA
jgi:sugar phosphate isomerase/epimerase